MQTKEPTGRKPDRRTLYTRRTIKDALLELVEKGPYDKITVASLCRQAEITRATFYLHFQGLDEVLNELLDEALAVAESVVRQADLPERMEAQEKLLKTGTAEDLRRNQWMLSPCQRVADDPKYRVIFQDPTLSGYVINRIYRMERDETVPYLADRCHISRDQADKLFMMIVFGLFYVNRSLNWNKDDDWFEMQLLAIRFVLGGWEALRKRT